MFLFWCSCFNGNPVRLLCWINHHHHPLFFLFFFCWFSLIINSKLKIGPIPETGKVKLSGTTTFFWKVSLYLCIYYYYYYRIRYSIMSSSSRKEKKKHDTFNNPPRFFRHPFIVLSLALTAGIRYIVREGKRISQNPIFRFVFLPLVLLWCSVSLFIVPTRSMQLFSAMDTNGDGLISLQELGQFYASYLHGPLPESNIIYTPLGAAPADGANEHSSREISTANYHAQQIAMSLPSSSVQYHHLNYSSFQIWWDGADYRSTSNFYRRDVYMSYGIWREVEFIAADAVFWLVLGILSSIGFGTGMHSGILFLFPHIYKTCAAADRCGGISNFWTYPVNPVFGPHQRAFQCISPYVSGVEGSGMLSQQGVTTHPILPRLVRVLFPCILWGAGTAIGEIPPYLLSYAAALKGKKQGELEYTAADSGWMGHMKRWTIIGIQRYGFWAVLLLSAWPNMAFDLCGMACGQFLLPFWSFFSAVLVGKAVIKVNLQALFFVTLFSGDNVEQFVWRMGRAVHHLLPPTLDAMKGATFVVKGLEKARHSISQPNSVISNGILNTTIVEDAAGLGGVDQGSGNIKYLSMAFECIVYLLMGSFCISILEQLAGEERERQGHKATTTTITTAPAVRNTIGHIPTKRNSSRRKTHSHCKASDKKEKRKRRNTGK